MAPTRLRARVGCELRHHTPEDMTRAHPNPGLWPLVLGCAVAASGCGGKKPALESGWTGRPAKADSQAGGGAVVSPIEASTERLGARTRASTPPRPQPPAEAAGASHMRDHLVRSALDELKFAEARNFRQKRNYTADISALEYWLVPGTIVRVVWANKWGWAALAADSLAPAEYCMIYVGSVPDAITPDVRHWGTPGQVYCDNRTAGGSIGRGVLYGGESPEQTLVRHAMSKMPTSLTQMVVAQEAYRKTQYTYSRRVEPMALQYGWEPGIRVRMLFASSEGWAAEATYDLLPGRSCVIWSGEVPKQPATAAQGRESPKDGVPVCDQ